MCSYIYIYKHILLLLVIIIISIIIMFGYSTIDDPFCEENRFDKSKLRLASK